MLQELLALLPENLTRVAPAVAFGIAGGGAILGICGARFSRSLLTLVMVAVGTYVGMRLPQWLNWGIDPMGPAFGAAIVLGLAGYAFHRMVEGILLGVVLAAAAGVGTWLALAPGATWQWPGMDWSAGAAAGLAKVWQSLPLALSKPFPIALATGLGVGGVLGAIWPKLGRVLLYSVGGAIVFVVAGAIGVGHVWPQWMATLPADMPRQAGIFAALVILFAGVQWLLLPRRANVQSAERSENRGVGIQGKRRTARQLSTMPDLQHAR
ncbi:MAG: hypothetical protein JWN51_2208 [Phycisphaerales bacterium]|nr:hypothetical protein [Phycisphaerales bacterium]